ncbi:MAG: shikimate dehydrogenase [Puniceicoccales bacterium]|jgi:shikimate dehydrogenase|nr:shikimate dehydrogenase [Puniceicoccales bacterium]
MPTLPPDDDTERVRTLDDLRRWCRDAPSLAVIGKPIAHSRSPRMHNAALAAVVADAAPAASPVAGWRYFKFEIEPADLDAALALFHEKGFRGLNLTLPHKVLALASPLVRAVSDRAAAAGAANVLVRRDDGFLGDNTDGAGFVRSVAEDLGVAAAGADVVLLGAGGAARGVGAALLDAGCRTLWLANRSPERLRALAEALRKSFPERAAGGVIREFAMDAAERDGALASAVFARGALVANATSLGLREGDPSPVPARFWRPDLLAIDIAVFGGRSETAFLREARAAGARTTDGRGMLCWQGALAFGQWTGLPAPVPVMRAALE